MQDPIAIVADGLSLSLELSMVNRHGLVAGATGTGKTVTLQSLAERFSAAGVPVFLADIKGDLSGLAAPGGGNAKVEAALEAAGMADRQRKGLPACFWDVYGAAGANLRAMVSDMGPLLLGRALGVSEVQSEVLAILFKIADDRNLEIVDLKDLRALIEWCGANSVLLEPDYGRMAPASLAALQRAIVVLEGQGGDLFFGEPALDINDFLAKDSDGRGLVSVLSADRLVESPALYATFLLWLLSELFEELPEAGDLVAPKLVFFFDEAHILFDGASPELVRSIVRTVRLIRSKGVGLWFVTQNPLDLPEEVLAQLGNRVQHALRAYTPKEQRAARAAAESFRPNPPLDVETALGELAVGEALVSFLGADGVPAPVQRARIVPPLSRVGPLSSEERAAFLKNSPAMARYGAAVDRVSAYEVLRKGATVPPSAAGAPASGPARPSAGGGDLGIAAARPANDLDAAMAELEAELHGGISSSSSATPQARASAEEGPYWGEPEAQHTRRSATMRAPTHLGDSSLAESLATSALRAAGNELGRQLVRGVLGGLSGGSRRRRRYY